MLILSLLGMYFDAAVVFVTKFSLLFRLALAILWNGSSKRILYPCQISICETTLNQFFDLRRVFLCVNNCSMKKSFRQQVGRPAIQVFSWHTSRQLLYAATFFLFQTTVKLIFRFYFQSTVLSTSSTWRQIISGVKKAFFFLYIIISKDLISPRYRKVASSRLSQLVAHIRIFRLFRKG